MGKNYSFFFSHWEKLFLTGNFLKVSGMVCLTYVAESGLRQDVSYETSRKADQLKGIQCVVRFPGLQQSYLPACAVRLFVKIICKDL